MTLSVQSTPSLCAVVVHVGEGGWRALVCLYELLCSPCVCSKHTQGERACGQRAIKLLPCLELHG